MANLPISIWLANVGALTVGSLILYLIYEAIVSISGPRSFSLPYLTFILIGLIGGILAIWFSWKSTAIILGCYAAVMVFAGLRETLTYHSVDHKEVNSDGNINMPGSGGVSLTDPTKHDPVEQTPEYLAVVDTIEKIAIEKTLEHHKTDHWDIGYCHYFWRQKKQILKKQYGIEWKTPREMNPGCKFD